MLVFGKETKGLPESLLKQYPSSCFRIPMMDKARSLNLSNSVAIVSYEALRQLGFPDMSRSGIGIKNLK
jgi:tRNA (cytidine/uridine-2'-O-)-methyltransferase